MKKIKNNKYEKIKCLEECEIEERSNFLYYLYQKIIDGDCTLEQYEIFFNYFKN